MQEHRNGKESFLLIHIVNVVALLLAGLIVLLAAVIRPYQLTLLIPVLVLLVVYRRYQTNPRVVAAFFGLSLGLLGWILVCEHIVTVDNIFGSQISTRLTLGLRLQSYVADNLHTPTRTYIEPCCGDPLTWHYRPGSTYRKTFDCETCGDPYEIVADETGYLNRQSGLMQSGEQIDLFLAGDSVMQGFGMPSVLEWVRTQIPLSMWNLSIAGYGARQKISALITYALPKRPKWLLVEFYAGNDLPEAIRDEACDSLGNFACRYNAPILRRQLSQHPVYRTIFQLPTGVLTRFAEVSTENLTLATTRYLIDTLKVALKKRLPASIDRSSTTGEDADEIYHGNMLIPPGGLLEMRQGQRLMYWKAGMEAIKKQYERLGAHLESLAPKPTVILLYNPAPYEVYRGIWVDPYAPADQASALLRDALRGFADTHNWYYLDLTDPLRQEVQAQQVWLYGQYDRSHLSPQGTAIVASVLSRELLKVFGTGESLVPPSKPVSGGRRG
jgi:hypothetical protein